MARFFGGLYRLVPHAVAYRVEDALFTIQLL